MATFPITVTSNADFCITVTEGITCQDDQGRKVKKVVKNALFRVEKSKLSTEYFRRMFKGPWRESGSDSIVLDDDDISAMEILFRCLHGTLDHLIISTLSVAIIWHLILVTDKYGVSLQTEALEDWFAMWLKVALKQSNSGKLSELQKQLLFPCYQFDAAKGFQEATKYLVYNTGGHIEEINPTKHRELHLEQRVMQQMNAARCGLRSVLYKALNKPGVEIIRCGRCDCKERTFFDYFGELERIGVWPLEEATIGTNMNHIIRQLAKFDSSRIRAPIECCEHRIGHASYLCPHGCRCNKNWKLIISEAAESVKNHFHGLCLDCMSITWTLQVGKDPDHQYWEHHRTKEYDINCRVRHGRATWYHSFMGRKAKRTLAGY
ncbi:hypothetical protein BJX70DRAFT_388756 [Aspergillus crustosus]